MKRSDSALFSPAENLSFAVCLYRELHNHSAKCLQTVRSSLHNGTAPSLDRSIKIAIFIDCRFYQQTIRECRKGL